MTSRIGVAAVFLAGCAVGGASSRLVVPKANAQQTAALPKWEYSCSAESGADDIATMSNKLGAEGWEMAAVDHNRWCFKRHKM